MKRVNFSLQVGAILSVVAVILSTAGPLQAQDPIWDNHALIDNLWSSSGNWIGDVAPVTGDSLTFNAVAAGAASNTVNDFAADSLTVNGITVNGNLTTLGGNEIYLNGDYIQNAGTATLSLNMVLLTNVTFQVLGTTVGFNNTMSGGFGLTKTGTGRLRLNASAVLSYSGDTIINTGSIDVQTGASLPNGAGKGNLIINSGGQMNLANASVGINGLSGSGTISKNGTGGRILTFGNGDASGVFTGTIVNSAGTFSFVKTGLGIQTLGGTVALINNGTTSVGAGTLLLNGTLTGLGTITTVAGATLGGTGSVTLAAGQMKILSGGTLSPGSGSAIGLLKLGTVAGLTFSLGSTYALTLNGTAQGTSYDAMLVNNGAITLGNSTLALTLGYTPSIGDTFDILSNTTAAAISGTFNGLAELSQFTVGGTTFSITYLGGALDGPGGIVGNDVVLSVVPEPSTVVLVGLGLLGAGVLGRRSRK